MNKKLKLTDTFTDKLDMLHADFCKIRQHRLFKSACILSAVLIVIAYGVFLYYHNKKYPRVMYETHKIGERVELGNNYIEIFPTREESIYSDGYCITLTNPRIGDFSGFIRDNTEEKAYSIFGGDASALDAVTVNGYAGIMEFFGGGIENNAPKKIIVVDALFENVDRHENWEKGIPIEDIRLTGIDWYAESDFVLSNIINGTSTISAPPGEQMQCKLMFMIYGGKLDLDKIEQEEMHINLTVAPTIVRVKLEF